MAVTFGWGESKKAPLKRRVRKKIQRKVLRKKPPQRLVKLKTEVGEALLELHNTARENAGLPPLRLNDQLTRAATAKAAEMSRTGVMSHTNADGSSFDKRISRTGYDWDAAGENIAEDFSSEASVFKAWMHSPSHHKNIVSPKFDEVGFAEKNGYYAAEFGSR